MTKRLASLDPKVWAFVVGIALSVAVGPALGVFSLKAMLQQQGSTPPDDFYTYCPPCPNCGNMGGLDGQSDPGPNGGDGTCGGGGDHGDGSGGGAGEGGGAPHPGKGEFQFGSIDLKSEGFGQWGHRRVFVSNIKFKTSIGSLQSYRWRVEEWTRLEINATRVYAVNGDRWSRSFKKNGDGSYSGDLFFQEQLVYNPISQQFTLTDTKGGITVYDNVGLFVFYSDPAGNTRSVTYGTFGGIKRPVEILATFTTGGHTYVESYQYSYALSPTSEYNLASIVLRRSKDGGAFVVVRQALYTYYLSSGINGIVNDLELVDIRDGSGATVEMKYYRYNGATLQYVVERRSFARLFADPTINGSLTNLRNASGATVGIYANLYVETDGTLNNRVTLRKVQGEGCSCGGSGNVGTFTYTYQQKQQAGSDPFNEWTSKMVSTDAANNQTITYENNIGQVLLQSNKITATGEEYITNHRYDTKGRRYQTAHVTAMLGYNEIYPDLTNNQALISPNTGLVDVNAWAAGDPPYLQDTYVLNGRSGTSFHQTNEVYAKIAGAAQLTSRTVYQDAGATVPLTTTYTYTTQGAEILSKTTTYPAVPLAHNGSGTGNVLIQYFDVYRHRTWMKDENLYIHYKEYDPPTGTMSRIIVDVNTSGTGFTGLPAGWATQAGAGLHLLTDLRIEAMGRPTKITDPKGNVAYRVYLDPAHEVRTYPGWNAGTLRPTGPTESVREDWSRSYDERLTMSATPTNNGVEPTGLEAVSNLEMLSRVYLNTADKATNKDDYFSFSGLVYLPNINIGILNTNFYRASNGYDVRGRQNRFQDGTGTITRTVYDGRGRTSSTWLGTNDTPVSGDWSPTNNFPPCNMLQKSQNTYDNGLVGDDTLTLATGMSESGNYPTQYKYDFRSRKTARIGADSIAIAYTLDNLGGATLEQTYGATSTFSFNPANLRSQKDRFFDERERVYLTNQYEVEPSTSASPGAVANKLPRNFWYNARGMLVKTRNANKLFAKSSFDGAGRLTREYVCFNNSETTYAAAMSATGNRVVEQRNTYYDQADNAVAQAVLKRNDNDTAGTGDLLSSASFAQVNVRWFDLANRLTNIANYGRDNAATRYVFNASGGLIDANLNGIPDEAEGAPKQPPGPASQDYLAMKCEYDSSGFRFKTTDNLGRVQQKTFDRTAKVLKTIDNYATGTPANGSLDTDVTVERFYLNGQQLQTLRAYNPKGGSVEQQDTTYTYGSAISRWWPTIITYADSVAGSDQEISAFDRLGRKTSFTDSRGVVHAFSFDSAGRPFSDAVTFLPGTVDNAVLRIQKTYDDVGRVSGVTSYNAAAGGTIVNDVQCTYNQFFAISQCQQEHGGAVVAGSPKVGYTYVDGAASGVAKFVRPNTLVYPATGTGARTLTFTYPGSSASSVGYHLDRLDSIKKGSTSYAQYTYYGSGSVLRVAHGQVSGGLNLDLGSGATYSGLDRFERIADVKWVNNTGATIFDDYQYAYDRMSNPISRAVRPTTPPAGKDDYYQYDGLDRLTGYDRGDLAGGVITDALSNFNQKWTALESTGNWRTFTVDPDGGTATNAITQTRTSNVVNEATAITNSAGGNWVPLTYNASGDMLSGPKPGAEVTTRLWYTYDAWNRLVKIQNDNAGVPGTTMVTHAYDGMGRRTIRNVSGGTTYHYYYDEKWRVIEVRYGTNTQPSEHYVWDIRYIDAPVVRFRATTTPGTFNETLYYTTDANQNVTALINQSHVVQERYTYDPYGNPYIWAPDWVTPRSTSSFANELLAAGYRRDSESALYHVRNRIYHPTLGRWIQRDPMRYHDGMNLYGYALNSPTQNVDPYGLEGVSCILIFQYEEGVIGGAGVATNEDLVKSGEEAKTWLGGQGKGNTANARMSKRGNLAGVRQQWSEQATKAGADDCCESIDIFAHGNTKTGDLLMPSGAEKGYSELGPNNKATGKEYDAFKKFLKDALCKECNKIPIRIHSCMSGGVCKDISGDIQKDTMGYPGKTRYKADVVGDDGKTTSKPTKPTGEDPAQPPTVYPPKGDPRPAKPAEVPIDRPPKGKGD